VAVFRYVWASQYSYSLWAGRSEDRISVGVRSSSHVQTGPEAHPASYTMRTGSFSAVKQAGRGLDHPPFPGVQFKERVALYIYSPSGSSWLILGWTLPYSFM